MDDVTKEFLVESGENLDQIERDLLQLEKNPTSKDTIASIFRSMHTIKGTCGFFGFAKLQSLTHSAESLLAHLRDGRIVFGRAIATAMLSTVDSVRKYLANIEKDGTEGEFDASAVIQTLTQLRDAGAAAPPPAPAAPGPAPAPKQEEPPKAPAKPSPWETAEEQRPQDLDEVVREFITESREALDKLERDLLVIEQNPHAQETLASIFRSIHTIKGTCGFFGFIHLETVSGAAEDVLGRLRDGKLKFSPELASTVLATVDVLRQLLSAIEKTGKEEEQDYSELLHALASVKDGGGIAVAPAPRAPEAPKPEPPKAAPPPAAKPEPVAAAPAADPHATRETRHTKHRTKLDEALLPEEDPALPAEHAPAGEPTGAPRGHGVAEDSIRVDVGLLDKLMDMVGELVLVRNQILQIGASGKDVTLAAACQRFNLVTTELQEGVMKTRMQPIGNIWSKFPRLVRDLALSCGKRVEITMEGSETDLDRTILEAMRDPLTHLVRNAVDHGIEAPDMRVASRKPPAGHITMRAFHESGQINIEVSDDGGGIAVEKVKKKALERGLISQSQASRMSHRELIDLIFLPGFSTAEQITAVSGRGVGLDVVKTNIEKLGGTVDILTKPGEGTTFKIKIPLTLAIIPALIITSAGDRYAIPQVSLVELVRLDGERAHTAVEMVYGAPVYRLRGNLLPLVFLSRELMLDEGPSGPESPAPRRDIVNIVVLQAGDRQFGLVVDRINDSEEIVVKPLGKHVKGIPCFAGATILGDGRVALILDVMGLAQSANVISELRERSQMEKPATTKKGRDETQSLLICRVRDDGRLAIPLNLVARLEEFSNHLVERIGAQEVVQYRGKIMPLLNVAEALPERRMVARSEDEPATESIFVVVYSQKDKSVGLVVEQILDIVEVPLALQRPASREGVLGCQVIHGRVTELLDVTGVIRRVDPSFFEEAPAA